MDPSFFKPLVEDFPKRLLIPPAFVQRMEGKLPSNLVLKYECERLYTVKIEELEENRFFFVNGWSQFVRDHGLEYGDFVVFRLIEDSVFQVTVYDPSMCEKDCCDSHRNNNGHPTASKAIKVEPNTSSPIDLTDKNEESVVGIESDDEPQDPGSDTDAPSFTLLLTETNKMYLPLPSSFATKTGVAKRREIKMRDPDGKKWPVKIIKEGKNVGLTRGWTGLFLAHRLKKGDTCIFKFLGVDVIQVIVKRGRGRPPNKE